MQSALLNSGRWGVTTRRRTRRPCRVRGIPIPHSSYGSGTPLSTYPIRGSKENVKNLSKNLPPHRLWYGNVERYFTVSDQKRSTRILQVEKRSTHVGLTIKKTGSTCDKITNTGSWQILNSTRTKTPTAHSRHVFRGCSAGHLYVDTPVVPILL